MIGLIQTYLPHLDRLGPELIECLMQTGIMIAVSGTIAWVLGIAIGVLLVICRPGGLCENRPLFLFFDKSIDILRSIPFIILIVLLIPLSRFLVGVRSFLRYNRKKLLLRTVIRNSSICIGR